MVALGRHYLANLSGAPLDDPSVSITRAGDVITATVTASVPRLVPGLSWRVTRVAAGEAERFVAETDRP